MKSYLSLIIMPLIAVFTTSAGATTIQSTTTPFSKYGQIQNVQNYSSNPFWDPSDPYNQRMPVPVYVTGADVTTSECSAIVGAFVASFCSARNNCAGMDVSEARPTITIQLASLPNHNYVTPCSGYIDSEFEKYKSQNAVAVPTTGSVAFPTATTPNTNINKQEFEFQNPATPQLPEWYGDTWMKDKLEREQELKNLQSANTSGNSGTTLARADFPSTASDLTFSQRMQLDSAGYEPYKDASAYVTVKGIESEEAYLQRKKKQTSETETKSGTTLGDTLKDLFQKDGDPNKAKNSGGEEKPEEKGDDGDNPTKLANCSYRQMIEALNKCQPNDTPIEDCFVDMNCDYFAMLPAGTSEEALIQESVSVNLTIRAYSDCIKDPVTNKITCCNTRYKDDYITNSSIGKYMFCGILEKKLTTYSTQTKEINYYDTEKGLPGFVRQCVQGNKKARKEESTLLGWARNDYWTPLCEVKICNSASKPHEDIFEKVKWEADEQNICWSWKCPTEYPVQINQHCMKENDATSASAKELNTYDYWIGVLETKE